MAPNQVDNLSAVLYKKDDLRMEQRPIPTPGPQQLLVKIHTVGICGSDVHYLTHGAIGSFIVKAPLVLGHETAGVVEEVGDQVKGFSVGDRVALEPGVPCRRCYHCKLGTYNLCPDMGFFATPPFDGSLTRFVVHDADFCFKLPDHVTFEEGALLEPLSVGVHTVRRAGVKIGQKALILGSGPIGILTLLVSKAAGASAVVITDIDDGRLAMAKELGADYTINVRGKSIQQVKDEITACLGQPPHVSMECTGVATSVETAILTTLSGGTIVLVGLGADRADLPMVEAAIREVDIRGVFRYANCYPTAIELVASKKVDLSKLTRAHYTLEETPEAFKRAQKADVIKVFINCEKKD
ncbi:unnamed protein product, partial [Mesorhabditis belari]|uniref:Sorbitol dehydrogenase n=1 Tax=Mesorhabditis belari TaxID=2138241 RepID=A0AAF3JBZ8_9BILA